MNRFGRPPQRLHAENLEKTAFRFRVGVPDIRVVELSHQTLLVRRVFTRKHRGRLGPGANQVTFPRGLAPRSLYLSKNFRENRPSEKRPLLTCSYAMHELNKSVASSSLVPRCVGAQDGWCEDERFRRRSKRDDPQNVCIKWKELPPEVTEAQYVS